MKTTRISKLIILQDSCTKVITSLMGMRSLVIMALLGFIVPQIAFAAIELRPAPQLLAFSHHGNYSKAIELINAYSFDNELLGRALHKALRANNAISKERIDYAEALILEGADLSYADSSGVDALKISTKQADINMVKLLLLHGADPEIKDNNGKDTKSYALSLQNGGVEITRLFTTPSNAMKQPEVKNIELSLKNGLVHINYELIGTGAICVSLEGSLDGGANYGMRFYHSSGDIGKDIAPGKRKQIIWKSKADYPKGLDDADVILDIVALNCG